MIELNVDVEDQIKIERNENEVLLSPVRSQRNDSSFRAWRTKQFSVRSTFSPFSIFSLSLSLPPSLARSKPRNCSRSNDIKPARNYFCPDPLKRSVSPREWRPEWCFQFVYLITHNCFTYTASRADASSRSRNLFSFFRLIFSPFFRHLLRSSLRFRFAFFTLLTLVRMHACRPGRVEFTFTSSLNVLYSGDVDK